jgi:hypothetical protein
MAQFLAFTIAGLTASEKDLHVMLNMANVGTSANRTFARGSQWKSDLS